MKRLNNFFGAYLTAILLLLLMGTISLQAIDKPNPPQNLTASLEDTDKDIAVKLEWDRDTTGTQPNFFFIYMVPKESDDPSEFKLFAKVPCNHNLLDFHFLAHGLHSGHYSFYVTAVLYHENQTLESDPSNIVKIEVLQKPFVHVIPAELLHGVKGHEFHFQVRAETNSDCLVLFGFTGENPQGMTIDEHTGNVNWTPQNNGTYIFRVRAWLDCDTSVFNTCEFKVQVGDSSYNKPFVHIVSKPNERGMPGEPYIYEVKAESNINCPILFELLPEHPDGMLINPHTGVITWTPVNAGSYYIGVRAYLECQPEVFAKQMFIIRIGDDTSFAMVKIVSKPPASAKPNSDYFYDVRAETNTDCHILFELLEHPDGMNIDQSGKITWHTPAQGSFNVAVKAYLDCRNEISFTQKYSLRIGDNNYYHFCAVIHGTATFENGDNVIEGNVKAIRLDSNRKDHPVFVGKITHGTFIVPVMDGNYALIFSGGGFKEEWYENATSLETATIVPVQCGDTITINAVLEKLPEPKHYKVSGRVTAEDDGSPVMANVVFIPVEKMNGRDGNEDAKNGFQTRTDDQGNYEITLPNTFTYIAHAIPAMNVMRYMDEFYDNATDPLEADIIELTGDLTGIDFSLASLQQYNNGFGGYVINGNSERIRARLIAHLVKSQDGHEYKFNQSVETDDQGNFSFHHLIPGDYVVLSIPFDRIYVPGYYKFQDFVTHVWRDATRITVGTELIEEPIEVKHDSRDSLLGVAKVNGNITSETLSIGKSGDLTQSGEPLAGAFVFVLDENGNVADYIFSNDYGNFELSELGVGTYTLMADKVGYYTFEQEISTDYETKSNVSLSFGMTKQPTEVTDETANLNDAIVYPSPIEAKATIRFNATAGNGRVLLYGSNGMQLADYSVQTIQGVNHFELNLNYLPTGAYFVRIINNNSIITLPVRVVR